MIRCFATVYAIAAVLFSLTSLPLAPSAHAGQLLVVSRSEQAVAFYDVDSKKLLETIPVGRDPSEIALSPDGRRAFVSNFGGHESTLTVLDVRARKALGEISISDAWGPHGLDVSSDGKYIYTTCEKSRVIVKTNVATGKEIKKFSTTMKGSHMLTLSPNDQWLYVVNNVDDNITIFDADTGEIERHILIGDYPDGLAVSPDGKELWVTAHGSNDVTIVNLKTNRKSTILPCRGAPARIAFTPDGKRAVVSCSSMGYVFVFDVAERSVVARVTTGDTPHSLAMEPDGARCYVTNVKSRVVSVLDMGSLEVTDEIPVIDTPVAIAYVE